MTKPDRLTTLLVELDETELETLWATCLKKSPYDSDFSNSNNVIKSMLVSKEWRSAHGHTMANMFREEHDLSWKRILIDVADKLKPGFGWTKYKINDEHTEEEIEEQILCYFDEMIQKSWGKFSESKQQKIANDLNAQIEFSNNVAHGKSMFAGSGTITATALSEGISSGLFTGSGALLLAQNIFSSVLGYFTGFLTNTMMSTSYDKSVPATLTLLSAIEMRKRLGEL